MRKTPRALPPTSIPSLLAAFALALAAGCGGIETDLHDPDPAQCLGGMEEIARFDSYASPNQLVWHEGTLYLNGMTSDLSLDGINAVSDQGGPMTKFSEGYYWMQADGDNLLGATRDKFSSIPFSGGPAQLVADGGMSELDGAFYGEIFGNAADSDFFYWSLKAPDGSYSVWAKPRTGGPNVKMGDADPTQGFGVLSSLTPAGQEIILTSTSGHAWAIDKTTLQWRALAACPSAYQFHTFVDTRGALWSSYTGGVGELEHFAMSQSSITGGPLHPFWQAKPSRIVPYDMFPDGSGGWVVNTLEWFSDGQIHSSVWTLDSGQHGQRRACLPAQGTATVAAAAYSPAYIYLAVLVWPTGGNFYTSLYRLARE